MKLQSAISLFLLGFSCAPLAATADALPEDAKPVSAASISKLYSGNSTDWKESMAYFAPDGTIKGVHTGNGNAIYWGTWRVKGNEICMTNDWKNVDTGESGGGLTDCWKWYVDGAGKPWQLHSVRFDGSKPGADDYYTDEIKKIRKGDIVSKKHDQLAKRG